jgi:hypothetical protein
VSSYLYHLWGWNLTDVNTGDVWGGKLVVYEHFVLGRDRNTYRTTEDIAILICIEDSIVEVDRGGYDR